MTPPVSQMFAHTPEYALLLAILPQAYVDLRDNAPAQERTSSLAFFAHERRHLEWLCDLADLDYTAIQAAGRRQYPPDDDRDALANAEGVSSAPGTPV